MTIEPIDPSVYVRPPIMTLESGITLCRALVAACPKAIAADVKSASKKLDGAADKAQAALAKRQKELGAISEQDARLIDQEGDASWGALRNRLLGYADLPTDEYPDATRAEQLITILFADTGLSFLKETYPVQWSVADTILKRIADEHLQKDIERIAGKEFLANIQKRHTEYGAMVKRLLSRNTSATVNLSAEVRALGRAIVVYATAVCASAKDDDEGTIALAQTALRPLDAFREASANRGSAAQGSSEPSADPNAKPSADPAAPT